MFPTAVEILLPDAGRPRRTPTPPRGISEQSKTYTTGGENGKWHHVLRSFSIIYVLCKRSGLSRNDMFGCICTGRPVQTNLQQVETNKFVFVLEDAVKINHVVVFLLPDTVLPDNMAATVFFQWPGQPFKLLGGISNSKQSAIFRISRPGDANMDEGMDQTDMETDQSQVTIALGIAIEPAEQVIAQLSALGIGKKEAKPVNTTTLVRPTMPTTVVAQKVIKNAFNFVSGFTSPDGSIPLKAFENWWTKFSSKLENDPTFLEKSTD